MNKKQKEVQQVFLDNEKAVLKKLEENYQDALSEINSKIELLMARQDADMQHVIYQVEYQKALKTQVQSILETLQTNEFETVSEYLAKSYEDGFIGTMYDLQGQGIPLVFPLDQAQVVAAIQHETKLSVPLYTALGKDVKDLQKKIAGEISRGISGGQMYSEIARNIAGWAMIPKNNAMRIARTEAHRIQCKATADAQFKAKEKGADVVKQWDASLDGKTRPHHRELDGQIRELEEPFEVGGMEAMQPGGFGIAAEDVNCRCALLQRARWALGNDYTKWSPDAPVLISDDGTTQFVNIEAKDYESFKKQYNQATERVRENVQKMNEKEEQPNKNYTSEEVSQKMFNNYKKIIEQDGLEGKWSDADLLKEIGRFEFETGSKMSEESSQRIQNKFVELLNKYKSGCTKVSFVDNWKGELYDISPFSRAFTVNGSEGTSVIKILNRSDNSILKELTESMKSGFNIKGLKEEDFPLYYITHEFGHTLVSIENLTKEHANYKKMKEFAEKVTSLYEEYKAELRRLSVERITTRESVSKDFASAMLSGDMKKMQEIQQVLNSIDDAIKQTKISDYAGKNVDEFLAESFALSELSTESSPYAEKVMELVKEYFGW